MGGHGGLNILPQKRWNGECALKWTSLQFCHAEATCAIGRHNFPGWGLLETASPESQGMRALGVNGPSCLANQTFLSLRPVYNRENRFKVAQDEAKAKEAEDAEEERHQQAEREYRHQVLLQRARGKAGETK